MEEKTKDLRLLEEFSVPSYEEWRDLVEKQLKGAPFDKKLVKKTIEGVTIQPIYQKPNQTESSPLPGQFPFIRGTKASGQLKDSWQISQSYNFPTPDQFNQAVTYDLERGLSSVSVKLDYAAINGLDPDNATAEAVGNSGVSVFSLKDLESAFNNVDLSKTHLVVNSGVSFLPLYCYLVSVCKNQSINPADLSGLIISDPTSLLAQQGTLGAAIGSIHDALAALVRYSSTTTPELRTLGIDITPYSESGASATQELSIAIALGLNSLREMESRGIEISTAALNTGFHLTANSDFFMNIAKLRALRQLWAQVVSSCGGNELAQKTKLHISTGKYNKTKYDPHVNLLRATTEAYSSVLGGSDSLAIEPFDSIFGLPDEFSRRVSRNIQVILRDECHGDKVIDPAGGSWYVEELTEHLAEVAWKEFQAIEEKGGIEKCLRDGSLQEKIQQSAEQSAKDIASRKKVIVGTNMYSNLEETLPEARQPNFREIYEDRKAEAASCKSNSPFKEAIATIRKAGIDGSLDQILELAAQGATLEELNSLAFELKSNTETCNALELGRIAESYETLRTKAYAFKEKHGELPKIFLATMGPLRQHKARADFSAGFLQPGGFATEYGDSYETVDDAVKATLNSKAKIVVICSTDDTYPELVPGFTEQLKSKSPDMTVVVAGYPKDYVEQFKSAGVDEFIHLKAENLSLLQLFQQKAGV